MQDENVSVLPMIYFPSVPGFNFRFERAGERERLGWAKGTACLPCQCGHGHPFDRPATDRPRLVYQRREAGGPESGGRP